MQRKGNRKNNIAVGLISAVRPNKKPEIIDNNILYLWKLKNHILKKSQESVREEVKLKSIR